MQRNRRNALIWDMVDGVLGLKLQDDCHISQCTEQNGLLMIAGIKTCICFKIWTVVLCDIIQLVSIHASVSRRLYSCLLGIGPQLCCKKCCVRDCRDVGNHGPFFCVCTIKVNMRKPRGGSPRSFMFSVYRRSYEGPYWIGNRVRLGTFLQVVWVLIRGWAKVTCSRQVSAPTFNFFLFGPNKYKPGKFNIYTKLKRRNT